jgi:hypothetical protein
MIVKARRGVRHARRVHGHVLRLLLEERIQEERILEGHAFGLAGGLDALGVALRHGLRVEQQPPDQGGLAVVDVADHHEIEVIQWRRSSRGGGGGRGGGIAHDWADKAGGEWVT